MSLYVYLIYQRAWFKYINYNIILKHSVSLVLYLLSVIKFSHDFIDNKPTIFN